MLVTSSNTIITTKFKFWVKYWFKISAIISLIMMGSLLLTVSIIPTTIFNHWFNVKNAIGFNFYSTKMCCILILILLIISAILLVIVAYTSKVTAIHEHIVIVSVLAIFSINILALGYHLIKHYQWQKQQGFTNLSKKWWQNFKSTFGIKKWLILDYVMIATFCALTITCAFIEQNFLPHLPYGGSIALKYIPLMIISYTISFAAGWLTGMISALMSLLFVGGYVISPWSFLLDYFLPMTTTALVAFLRFNLKADKSIFTYINYFLHCFLVCLIIYIWQTLSGYFIWIQAFGTRKIWVGFTPLFYSLAYNFIHIFLFTYPIMQLTIPLLYRSFVSHYIERYR